MKSLRKKWSNKNFSNNFKKSKIGKISKNIRNNLKRKKTEWKLIMLLKREDKDMNKTYRKRKMNKKSVTFIAKNKFSKESKANINLWLKELTSWIHKTFKLLNQWDNYLSFKEEKWFIKIVKVPSHNSSPINISRVILIRLIALLLSMLDKTMFLHVLLLFQAAMLLNLTFQKVNLNWGNSNSTIRKDKCKVGIMLWKSQEEILRFNKKKSLLLEVNQ